MVFGRDAWDDYLPWQAEDAKVVERINALIEECLRHPFNGTGKPEPLKRQPGGLVVATDQPRASAGLSGGGSGETQALEVLSCRYHY